MEPVGKINKQVYSLCDIEKFIRLHPVKVPVTEFLFDSNYTSLKSDEQRVLYIMDVWKEKNFRSYGVGEFGKSLRKSIELRLKGNEAFKKRDYMSAIALYTRSVSYAPHPYTPFINNEQSADNAGSEDCYIALALSVANRSAALFEMKKYEACLKDIAYALSMNYPADLSHKLHLRQAKCLHALGKKQDIGMLQAELENLSLTGKCSGGKKLSLKIELEKLATNSSDFLKKSSKERAASYPDVEISYGENNTLPHYSSCVELRNTEDMGRGIFATRNIEIGDVILVEKPFSWSLHEDSFYTHCHFCCKPCRSLIPCWHCSLAMFCSEECLKNCWEKFHDLDCSLLPVLLQMKFPETGISALRTVIIASKMFKSISDFCKTGKLLMKNNGNYPFANIGNHSDYFYVYNNLITNTEFKPDHHLLMRCLHAVIMSKLLAERTNFFPRNSECGEEKCVPVDKLRHFVGYLLTRHSHNITHGLHSNKLCTQIGEFSSFEMPMVGSAIYPQISLLNHSCDPNVFNYTHLGNHIVVRAWRKIKCGEQLFDTYGTTHAHVSREERQSYLYETFYFKCHCIACTEDWPTRDKLKYGVYTLKCNSCGNALSNIGERVIICTKCHKANDYQKICKKLEEVKNLLSVSNGKDVLEIFGNIKKILHILNTWVHRPSCTLITMEIYFRTYFFRLSNCSIDD